MFETLGVPELLIILAIVMLLFGAGKVGRLGKDLGTSVREFRRAMSDDDDDDSKPLVSSDSAPKQLTADATATAPVSQSAPTPPIF